jgi:transposase
MNFIYFIGVDISKDELDFSLIYQNQELLHLEVSNDTSGVRKALAIFKKQIKGFDLSQTLFCMEPTGIYNTTLMKYLEEKKGFLWLESARQIQDSMGMQRGKSDRLDARKIAKYAYKNREDARLWQPARQILTELQNLLRNRERLLTVRKQLTHSIDEQQESGNKKAAKQTHQFCAQTLRAIEIDLKNAEKAIEELVKSDQQLTHLTQLITSVEGVGVITAYEIILTTNEFKDIREAKKFACYSGVVPFENSSGKKAFRTKVSHLANKKMKSLLHMAALAAIRYNRDLKAYFERKTKAGKNKMLVINAVRNKLLHRIFACVRNDRKYEKTYLTTLV